MKKVSVIVLLSLLVGLSSPLYIHIAPASDKDAHYIIALDLCNRAHAGVSVNDGPPFIPCQHCIPTDPPKAGADKLCKTVFKPLSVVFEKDRPPKA